MPTPSIGLHVFLAINIYIYVCKEREAHTYKKYQVKLNRPNPL